MVRPLMVLVVFATISCAIAACACNGQQNATCAPYCPCQTATGYCTDWDDVSLMHCDPKQGHARSGCFAPKCAANCTVCACNGQNASCAPHCPCQTATGYCTNWYTALATCGAGAARSGCGQCQCNGQQDPACSPNCPCQSATGYCTVYADPSTKDCGGGAAASGC
jgi:hypothetical protein